jgi:hypothetical protein
MCIFGVTDSSANSLRKNLKVRRISLEDINMGKHRTSAFHHCHQDSTFHSPSCESLATSFAYMGHLYPWHLLRLAY